VKHFMNKKSEIGKLGEDLACEYLFNKRFKIIERNFRKPWGELDIIAKDSEDVLVFVEVKTMRKYDNAANNSAIAELNPEDNLTSAKLTKLKRTAYLYANENSELVNDKKGWRIDLVAISITDVSRETFYEQNAKTLTELLKHCEIKHFENL